MGGMPNTFLCGFVFAFCILVIGYIISRPIQRVKRRAGDMNRPLDTWPDAIQDTTTPGDIFWGSCLARIVWWTIIALSVVGIILLSGWFLTTR